MHYLLRKWKRSKLPRKIKNVIWWFQYRFNPKHRYHVLKFAEPGWIDRDHAMLRCAFTLLDDFLEKEPVHMVMWEAAPDSRHAMTEMRLLHFWWKHQRDQEDKEQRDLFSRIFDDTQKGHPDPFDNPNDMKVGINPFFDKMDQHPLWPEWQNMVDYTQNIDQKQLERLVKIRPFMWT